MKLPSEPNTSTQASKPSNTPLTGAAAPAQPKLPQSIQTLIHTWAKVESSQPLPQGQNQQVLNQLAQLSGQSLTTPMDKQGTGISEKLNLSNIAQTLTQRTPIPQGIKLNLVKLMTIKGAINILSERPLTTSTQVLLTQTPEGRLTIKTPQNATPLNQFRGQFIAQNSNPTPIPLLDTHQASSKPNLMGSHLTPIPSTTLKADAPLTPDGLKQAIVDSGQNLEFKLAQLASKHPTKPTTLTPENRQPQGQTQADTPDNMSSKLVKVEQNIQKWVTAFQQKRSNPAPESSPKKPAAQMSSALNTSNGSPSPLLKNKSLGTESKSSNHVSTNHALINNDHKSWLVQNQHQLFDTLNKQLQQHKDSFIPNWPGIAQQGQTPSNHIKTFQDVGQWLELLMMPKHTNAHQAQPLWPKALSVHPQLQQTLNALLNSFIQEGSDSGETALLRQLLNINQSLSKLTHEQIQNRLWQGQSDTIQFQLSLPFVQQNQVHWCEFECKQQTASTQNKEQTTGWHLILRFAQASDHAFAIESHLKQEQVNLTLWANQAEQLKHLHQNMPLIKRKLEQAGFKIESITSQHGIPKPLQQPIQQSLIDIHT